MDEGEDLNLALDIPISQQKAHQDGEDAGGEEGEEEADAEDPGRVALLLLDVAA